MAFAERIGPADRREPPVSRRVTIANRGGVRPLRKRRRGPSPLRPHLLHELVAVGIDLLRTREEIAPHLGRRRQRWQRPAERLDHEPAVVLDLFQRGERLVPADHAGAGGAAIVLADVDVGEVARHRLDASAWRLLLDVCMKAVVHRLQRLMADALRRDRALACARRQEVALESFEVCDAELQLVRGRELGRLARTPGAVQPSRPRSGRPRKRRRSQSDRGRTGSRRRGGRSSRWPTDAGRRPSCGCRRRG